MLTMPWDSFDSSFRTSSSASSGEARGVTEMGGKEEGVEGGEEEAAAAPLLARIVGGGNNEEEQRTGYPHHAQ